MNSEDMGSEREQRQNDLLRFLHDEGYSMTEAHRLAEDIFRRNNRQHINSLPNEAANQAIALLSNIANFSGSPSIQFDNLIRHFESVIDLANWSNERKAQLLCSKLMNTAAECIDDFKLTNHEEAYNYDRLKAVLRKRFHSSESRQSYLKLFQKCTRNAGESVVEYAHRLQKLFNHAHPLATEGNNSPEYIRLREEII